uniref:Uncharacterized protein n=1 Tax=Caenorhabditis japonica TaxID=281687 RepID=A0A8R1IX48_CAEJA
MPTEDVLDGRKLNRHTVRKLLLSFLSIGDVKVEGGGEEEEKAINTIENETDASPMSLPLPNISTCLSSTSSTSSFLFSSDVQMSVFFSSSSYRIDSDPSLDLS